MPPPPPSEPQGSEPLRSEPARLEQPRFDPARDPDFEDEPPGSYLAHLGTHPSQVIWGLVTAVGTGLVAEAARGGNVQAGSQWYPLLSLLWVLLPLSGASLTVVLVWQLFTAHTRKPPLLTLLAWLFAMASLGVWAVYSFGFEVLPRPPELR